MKKRIFLRVTLVLAMAMVLSILPQFSLTAFATGNATTLDVSDTVNFPSCVTYNSGSKLFTIGTGANGQTIAVTGTTTANTITVAAGVTGLTLTLNNASITSPSGGQSAIDLQGTANVTIQLTNGTTNILDASNAANKAGLCVPSTAVLTINGASGSLTAKGNPGGSGIGGRTYYAANGKITINGGTVNATGGNSAAGIGGGASLTSAYTCGGDIIINGGTVNATGGLSGAGIGGGFNGSGSIISINGGTVNATGATEGAGIGGGFGGAGGTITISKGTVIVTGGSTATGIGCGNYSSGTITAVTIDSAATIMVAASGGSGSTSMPAIDAQSGSGSVINAKLISAISTTAPTYLNCNGKVLTLPKNYKSFAFSAAAASAVNAYSDSGCTTLIGNIWTASGYLENIPVTSLSANPTNITSVMLPYTATVTVNKDGSAWSGGTPAIQLSTVSGTLTSAGAVSCSGNVYTYEGLDTSKTYYVWNTTTNKYTGQSVTKTSPNATLNYYSVTFAGTDGGTASAGVNITAPGDTVTLTATPGEGHSFSSWSVCKTGDPSTTVAVSTNTFTMPAYPVTVAATFTAIKYTVTYDAGSGSVAEPTTDVTYGSIDPLLIPTRAGYTFGGWCDEGTGNLVTTTAGFPTGTVPSYVASGKWSLTAAKTVYAKWAAISYALTVNLNGGNGNNNSGDYGTDSSILITAGSRSGYTFAEWTTSDGGTFTGSDSPMTTFTMPPNPTTITANWTANKYTVTYDAGSGTVGNPSTDVAYDSADALLIPTRTGYDFGGWYTGTGGTGMQVTTTAGFPTGTVPSYVASGKWRPTGSKTVYAKWTATDYTVTYDAESGSVSPASTAVTYDSADALAIPTRTGYTFGGWYIGDGGTSSQVTTAAGVPTGTVAGYVTAGKWSLTAGKTVYAKWTVISYTLTVNLNGGSGSTTNGSHATDSSFSIDAGTKTGYTFTGWTTSSGGTFINQNSAATTFTMPPNATTITANWTASDYTVTYDAESGSVSPALTAVTYDSSDALAIPTRTSYTFNGWYDGDGGTGNQVTTAAGIPTGTVTGYVTGGKWSLTGGKTVYAKWTANDYTVTYDAESGSVTDATTDVTYDSNDALLIPTRTGYAFGGWYDGDNGTGNQVTTAAGVPTGTVAGYVTAGKWSLTAGKTVYAKWTVISYTLTVNLNGGSGTTTSGSHATDSSFSINAGTKAGYTFNGWTTLSGGIFINQNSASTTFTMPPNATTITANWTASDYTVTYDAESGSVSLSSTPVTYDSADALLVPTRTGYTFGGWYDGDGGTGNQITTSAGAPTGTAAGYVTSGKWTLTAGKTVYAKWTAADQTLTFDGNGSTGGSMSNVVRGTDTTANLPVNTFTKSGYTFAGWNKESEGGGTSYADGASFTMPAGGDILYAQWTAKTAVSITETPQSVTYDGAVKAFAISGTPPTGYTVEYYVASAWTTGAPTNAGQYDVRITRTEDVTYDSYNKTITNGLTITKASQAVTAVGIDYTTETVSTTADMEYNTDGSTWNDCTATMSVAAGWFGNDVQFRLKAKTNYDAGAAQTVAIPSRPATPTAVGTNETSSGQSNGSISGVSAEMEYKVGAGSWQDISGTTLTNLAAGTYIIRVKATLTSFKSLEQTVILATGSQLTVTFNSNSGSAVSAQNVNYNALITEPSDQSRAGYTFDGWYKETELNTLWDFTNDKVTANITLYAKWTANSYLLTVSGGGTGATESGNHNTDSVVSIDAGTRAGYIFDGWTSSDGGSFTDENSATTTFTMPPNATSITASWTGDALTGTAGITGDAVYGQTLTATLTGSNNTGTLSYQWTQNGSDITSANSSTYTLITDDVGKVIGVKITSSTQTGALTGGPTAEVDKADCAIATGATPELSEKRTIALP